MKSRYVTAILISLMFFSMGLSVPLLLPPGGGGGQKIRVMSFNLHQYYVEDSDVLTEKTGDYTFADLLEVLQDAKPDILGLQESEGLRLSSGNQNGVQWLAQKLGMYYYYGPPTSEQIYGDAVLSRWPIVEEEWKLMPRSDGIERAIVRVVIDSPLGKINVFNTHFEIHRFEEDQRRQAEFVVNYVGARKAIILGDFNSRPDRGDEAFKIMNDHFTFGMVESGLDANASSGYTGPASDPAFKIDYVWLTRGDWNVVQNSYTTYGTTASSDHLGVLIEIVG